MSHQHTTAETHRPAAVQWPSLATLLLAVLVTRLADMTTTYVGQRAGLAEDNPVVAAARAQLGTPLGLAVTSICAVVVLIATVEGVIRALPDETPDWSAPVCRTLGYGLFALGSGCIAADNAALLGGPIA